MKRSRYARVVAVASGVTRPPKSAILRWRIHRCAPTDERRPGRGRAERDAQADVPRTADLAAGAPQLQPDRRRPTLVLDPVRDDPEARQAIGLRAERRCGAASQSSGTCGVTSRGAGRTRRRGRARSPRRRRSRARSCSSRRRARPRARARGARRVSRPAVRPQVSGLETRRSPRASPSRATRATSRGAARAVVPGRDGLGRRIGVLRARRQVVSRPPSSSPTPSSSVRPPAAQPKPSIEDTPTGSGVDSRRSAAGRRRRCSRGRSRRRGARRNTFAMPEDVEQALDPFGEQVEADDAEDSLELDRVPQARAARRRRGSAAAGRRRSTTLSPSAREVRRGRARSGGWAMAANASAAVGRRSPRSSVAPVSSGNAGGSLARAPRRRAPRRAPASGTLRRRAAPAERYPPPRLPAGAVPSAPMSIAGKLRGRFWRQAGPMLERGFTAGPAPRRRRRRRSCSRPHLDDAVLDCWSVLTEPRRAERGQRLRRGARRAAASRTGTGSSAPRTPPS